jgi:hypothetical protein
MYKISPILHKAWKKTREEQTKSDAIKHVMFSKFDDIISSRALPDYNKGVAEIFNKLPPLSPLYASGGGGGSASSGGYTGLNSDPQYQGSITSAPATNISPSQTSTTYINQSPFVIINPLIPNTSPSTILPNTEILKEKSKYTTDQLKCKLIAHAILYPSTRKLEGMLFIRKCGAWKFIDPESNSIVASGGIGSVLPSYKVLYVIYSNEKELFQKPTHRFDDLIE